MTNNHSACNHPDYSNGLDDQVVIVAGFNPCNPPRIEDFEDPRNWDVLYDEDGPFAR